MQAPNPLRVFHLVEHFTGPSAASVQKSPFLKKLSLQPLTGEANFLKLIVHVQGAKTSIQFPVGTPETAEKAGFHTYVYFKFYP